MSDDECAKASDAPETQVREIFYWIDTVHESTNRARSLARDIREILLGATPEVPTKTKETEKAKDSGTLKRINGELQHINQTVIKTEKILSDIIGEIRTG